MTANQRTPLQTAVYNQLRADFDYWTAIVYEMKWSLEQHRETGRTDFLIAWEEMDERLFSSWIRANQTVGGELMREIEENISLNENQGVFYLNKWADLSNQIEGCINDPDPIDDSIRNDLADLQSLSDGTLTDTETAKKFNERANNLLGSYAQLSNAITEELSKIVWYKQHSDLIRINNLSAGAAQRSQQSTSTDQEPGPTELRPEKSVFKNLPPKVLLLDQLGFSGYQRYKDCLLSQRAS